MSSNTVTMTGFFKAIRDLLDCLFGVVPSILIVLHIISLTK